jgi:hypothetical protein
MTSRSMPSVQVECPHGPYIYTAHIHSIPILLVSVDGRIGSLALESFVISSQRQQDLLLRIPT